MQTKAQQAERNAAIARLQEWLKPGDTVYTILRHVGRSGMSRVIDLVIFRNDEPLHISYNAAKAMGRTMDQKWEGLKVTGAGMDMGFHEVYNLSRALFHVPGENTPDAGYALKQRWL